MQRGVTVIALLPADHQPALAPLGAHRQFTCVNLAARQANGARCNIHVHAKLMIVDDVFAAVGSCNLRTRSLLHHTEMNASVYDPSVVRGLRCELFTKHLMVGTESSEDEEAMRQFAEIAQDNAQRLESWQGNVTAVSIES